MTTRSLTALYNATNGSGWVKNSNWLEGDPCANEWHGVTCDADGTHVVALELWQNSLRGRIPSEIGNLKQLTEL